MPSVYFDAAIASDSFFPDGVQPPASNGSGTNNCFSFLQGDLRVGGKPLTSKLHHTRRLTFETPRGSF